MVSMYLLSEASSPKLRSWRLDDGTVVAAPIIQKILPKLKWKQTLQTAGYLGPDLKQPIKDSFDDRGILVELKIVTLKHLWLCVSGFKVNNKRDKSFS